MNIKLTYSWTEGALEGDAVIFTRRATAICLRNTHCYFEMYSAILTLHIVENENRRYVVDWLPLDSSVFTSAAYLPATHTLYLQFHSGELYCYFDFPPQQYRDFLAADSKGQYFSSHIRNRFRYQHLSRRAAKRR